MCPITGSIAERRRSSRLMRPKTPLLTGDEDATRVGGIVAAIALIDIGAFDRAAGELLGGIDDAGESMAVIGIARQRLGVKHLRPRRPVRADLSGIGVIVEAQVYLSERLVKDEQLREALVKSAIEYERREMEAPS
jgi:hypothetical protein